jgi:branched-chain amino acid transport system permease protein
VVFTLLLAEALQVMVGHDVHILDGTIYGLMLAPFIIYMPKDILRKLFELSARRGPGAARLSPTGVRPRQVTPATSVECQLV